MGIIALVETAGVENVEADCRGGKCRSNPIANLRIN